MLKSVFSFSIFFLLLVFSSRSYAQIQDYTFSKNTSTRIIESFYKNINHSKLKRDGLIVKEISTCDMSSEDTKQVNLPWYDKRKLKDSIISIQENDEEIIVQFIVYEISYLIIGWQTNVEIRDKNILSLICFPIVQAMSHEPQYTPVCISIHFVKTKALRLENVILNKKRKP